MAVDYYMLVGSLPRLEHFERAERLPINRLRLEQRLRNLAPDHFEQLEAARGLVEWRQQPAGRTDAEAVDLYRRVVVGLEDPGLRAFVEFRMDQRTVMAGLRRRLRGALASDRPGLGRPEREPIGSDSIGTRPTSVLAGATPGSRRRPGCSKAAPRSSSSGC